MRRKSWPNASSATALIESRTPNRVLVVDDDFVTRSMITDFLSTHGFEVVSFADAKSALESINEHRPQLIISDWEMPEMDGLELCQRVRDETKGNHVHFIMLTVHASKEELARAFDAGVDDFLAKPFEEVELMARLRSGLRGGGERGIFPAESRFAAIDRATAEPE